MKPNDPIIPPHNSEAEASLLGALLIDSDAIVKIADQVSADDFYVDRHRQIFSAVKLLYDKHSPIDVLTLTDQLKASGYLESVGGSAYLTELTNFVPTAAHVEQYGQIVATKALRRRLIKASNEIAKIGFDEEQSLQTAIEQAETKLFEVSQQHTRQDVADLIVLAARPSMGKTALALNLAHNVSVKAGLPVLIFSLEMSKEQLVDRMLAAEADVDAWNLRTGNLSDSDFEKIGQAMGALSEAPIFIDDTPSITVSEMRTKARREGHRRELGLIIVDYLQLMSGGTRFSSEGNRVQEISEISRGLKGIARELNVPLLALSQLSRSVENRHPQIPQLADLRESGSIEQDADVVAFIYREEYYNPETDRKNITDIFVKKHRNGPTGAIEIYFDREKQRFSSLDTKHSQPFES